MFSQKRLSVGLVLCIFLLLLLNTTHAYAYISPVSSGNVHVSVSIGEVHPISLFGYTSPYAQVTLQTREHVHYTQSDGAGFFSFERRLISAKDNEYCLSSKDSLERISPAVCMPIDYRSTLLHMGPFILPPTISASKSEYELDETVVITGSTLPHSPVGIHFFANELVSIPLLSLIPKAKASSLPVLETFSDGDGNYSLSIDTSNPQETRIFSGIRYQDTASPQSNYLNVRIVPWWITLYISLKEYLTNNNDRLLLIIVLIESAIVCYILMKLTLFDKIRRRKNYPLAVLRDTTTLLKT